MNQTQNLRIKSLHISETKTSDATFSRSSAEQGNYSQATTINLNIATAVK